MKDHTTEGNAQILNEKEAFKGYSLNQLRYQRAVVALQREFAKEKIRKGTDNLKNRTVFGKKADKGAKGTGAGISKIANAILNRLGYLDYAVIGLSLFKTGKKIAGLVKRK